MAQAMYLVAYAAIAVFLVAVVVRFMMWSRMPIHVRWELYPVAHEAKKAHYGGSYLEESDWWTKPRETSLVAELKVMLPEIFFLVALKEHNFKLWLRSFPFHFGLYLVIGAAAVALGGGVVGALSAKCMAGGFGSFVRGVFLLLALPGLALGLLGGIGLLHRRLTDPDLKDFTAPADIFNLVFFVVAFAVTLATLVFVDGAAASFHLFAKNLVTLKLTALPGTGIKLAMPVLSLAMLCGLVAYVPLTHMSHFIGKYFAYHSIRWNDKPNLPGSEEEEEIKQVLMRPVSWSAPHIKGDGKRTWADVATTLPAQEKRK